MAPNIARAVGGGEEARFDGHGSCFSEIGDGKAGPGTSNFFAEPRPAVTVRRPARIWHAGKVLLEKQILGQWLC